MRGSNIRKDLRLLGYEFYPNFSFAVVNGCKGDCLDRYLVRMNECIESIKLIYQCISLLSSGLCCVNMQSNTKQYFSSFSFIIAEQEAPKGEMLLSLCGRQR